VVIVVVVVALAGVVAGVLLTGGHGTKTVKAGTGRVAPDFKLPNVRDGQPDVSLASYRGRPVLVNFWATWCVPCVQEIPEISAFQKAHKDVVVIGIAMDAENPAKVKQFATKVGHDYTLVLSDDSVEDQMGTPHALPATRIYDPTGKVVYDRVGRVTKKVLEDTTKTSGSKAGSA